MSFLARIDHFTRGWFHAKATGKPAQGRSPRRSKQAQRSLAVLEELEFKQTVSDTLFAGAQLAGAFGTLAVAGRTGDPFPDSSVVDFSVSGGSSSGSTPSFIERIGWQGAEPQMDALGGSPSSGSEVSRGEPPGAGIGEPEVSPTQSDSTSHDIGDAAPASVLPNALSDPVPRPHGAIRKLQLAPPVSAVGASTTFVADTSGSSPQAASDIAMPPLDTHHGLLRGTRRVPRVMWRSLGEGLERDFAHAVA